MSYCSLLTAAERIQGGWPYDANA